MSNTMNWVLGFMEAQDEKEALKRELEAKEDRITALETQIAQLRLCIKVMAAQIPQSITETRTVTFL